MGVTWWNPLTWVDGLKAQPADDTEPVKLVPTDTKKSASLLDHVFDWRTGYWAVSKPFGFFNQHPAGEGSPERFLVLRSSRPLPFQLRTFQDPDGEHVRPCRYSFRLNFDALLKLAESSFQDAHGLLDNLWDLDTLSDAEFAGLWFQAEEADFTARSTALDTRQNAVLTAGSGKTYATISAAITAASSGDSIDCYDATWSETVAYGSKVLSIINRRAGIMSATITASTTGAVVTGHSTQVGFSYLINFTVTNSHASAGGSVTAGTTTGAYLYCLSCRATGTYSYGFAGNNVALVLCFNCVADNITGTGFGINGMNALAWLYHCTACKCGYGIASNSSWVRASWSLAAGNTTADYTAGAHRDHCVSADLTAISGTTFAGCATGFDTADFEDYANNDFRLRAAVAGTTVAKLYGRTIVRTDAWDNVRAVNQSDTCDYAGASTALPGYIPVAAEVVPAVTAYGKDNELAGAAPSSGGTSSSLFGRRLRSY